VLGTEEGSTYLGNGLAVKTYYNATKLLIAMFYIEVDLMSDLGACTDLSVPCIACACFVDVCSPLTASELCAKKAKVIVRISKADTTIRWREDMMPG